MSENNRLTAVKKMLDYIDAHLYESMTLSMIAKAADYSQYHAARMFKEETGEAPFEYIRRKRLTDAAYTLRKKQSKVSTWRLTSFSTVTRALQEHLQTHSVSHPKGLCHSLSLAVGKFPTITLTA